MSDTQDCNCEQSLRLTECLEHSNRVLEVQTKELEQYRKDFAEIAGHFTIPVPEPGSITSKLLSTIAQLKADRRDLTEERDSLKDELSDLRYDLSAARSKLDDQNY